MLEEEIAVFYPGNSMDWNNWLAKNHERKSSVWCVFYRKHTNIASISWSEAVDEALCYGWIDSKKKTLNGEMYVQFFSRRKPGSTWSKVNKQKVSELIRQKRMRPAGMASIKRAKQDGSWTVLDEVEALKIPDDLEEAFKRNPDSRLFFTSQCKSLKKQMLQWIMLAKQSTTRSKRILELAIACGRQTLPKPFLR